MEKRWPHRMINEKNNGMSSAQEVHYPRDFKKADKAAQQVTKEGH